MPEKIPSHIAGDLSYDYDRHVEDHSQPVRCALCSTVWDRKIQPIPDCKWQGDEQMTQPHAMAGCKAPDSEWEKFYTTRSTAQTVAEQRRRWITDGAVSASSEPSREERMSLPWLK